MVHISNKFMPHERVLLTQSSMHSLMWIHHSRKIAMAIEKQFLANLVFHSIYEYRRMQLEIDQ